MAALFSLEEHKSSIQIFLKTRRLELGQVPLFFYNFTQIWKIWCIFTLKLSAVILPLTGTVYMLLCNEGRHSEEQRQFDCYKS